jgi:tetratricopeptide (TPR) repeat protein
MRSWILKRQGKWDEALASHEKVLALSPREPDPLFSLARTYFSLRRYEEAEAYFDRTLALQPDYVEARLFKAMVPFLGRGDTRPLRALVEGIPPGFDPSGYVVWALMVVEYYDRDYTAALEVLSRSELRDFGSSPRTVWMGMCYANLGQTDLAHAAGDSARRELEAQLRERPDDPGLYSDLAWAHFLLGDKEEAIAAAQRAVELMPISKDAVDGPGYVYNLANVYARFGEAEAAVEHLERFLSVPSMTSVKYTKIDPAFDRVRDDPRFQALVARYE